MILDFTLTNCRVFHGDDTTLYCHTESRAENSIYALHKSGNLLISKYIGLWGAAGSGKSIMLDSLFAVASFVTGDANALNKVLVPHFSHEDEPTTATLTFLIDERKYEYSVTLHNGVVTKESLRCKKTRKYSTICKQEGEITESTIAKDFLGKNEDIRKVHSFMSRMVFKTKSSENPAVPKQQILQTLLGDEKILKFMSDLFRSSDLGVDSIAFDGENVVGKVAYGENPVNYAEMTLDDLGSGAKCLLELGLRLAPVIIYGGIAVIDGFDDRLHPLLAEHIMGIFKHEEVNTKNAQLICSLRTVDSMNSLSKQQIVLFNRLGGDKSEVYSLNDIQGVRNDDNFSAKYLAGAYGATPNI